MEEKLTKAEFLERMTERLELFNLGIVEGIKHQGFPGGILKERSPEAYQKLAAYISKVMDYAVARAVELVYMDLDDRRG
ncbi:MAG: hypothetical protein PHU23_02210 [Dehalococcoidales bacterium]|nr:hypothetical protein [Dehalococcoidales bacterium]